MKAEIKLILMLQFYLVSSQDKCKEDKDCKENAPCCSGFGYCGSGEGFCTPAEGSSGGSPGTRRSGSGCSADDVEYVGGDLSPLLGGGGVRIEKNSSKACYNKCEDNFRCKWFTYDEREQLCYLKSSRGYPRNRTDGFTSGSTERDGCDRSSECRPPYSYYSYQCLFYCDENNPEEISIADIRRNFNDSKDYCEKFGGFLPYNFDGYGGYRSANSWHWLGYSGQEGNCWAGRPGFWDQGIQSFPCSENLNFGCQMRGIYPTVEENENFAIRPRIYSPQLTIQPTEFGRTNFGYFNGFRRRLSLPRRRFLFNRLDRFRGYY
ncbi:uncharacterized protein LOC111713571 [Eurytemora carolleeae]|uniref:uncharacterized protein LOC111713571 n=1 Tax=Eurytemora carolleeae TaxID=1294199 RepID=UPI000C768427|nr:uncharacterized protein LOC111713571 [Eurytemora carolleeae]|eukprot:XP_023344219.1 uncharacterized protein LOC111713571 [Eurytemora affinis]